MPLEDQPVHVPNLPPGEEGWRRLAQDAANWPDHHEGLRALRENHVNRLLGEKGLDHLVVSKEDKAGARFVNRYRTPERQEVEHVTGYLRQSGIAISQKAGDRTAAYLGFMAEVVNDGILTGDPESVRRQINAHVIKTEDVPESYFALQRRIAREQGRGNREITPEERSQLIEAIQADQRAGLEKWVEYLGGEDGGYPDWFKYYTWDSVVNMGAYDKAARKFGRREADTVAPYPELNREALAYVYDRVKKFHILGEDVDDAKLKQLLKDGSFGRLYAHAFLEVTPDSPESRKEVRGSWTRFRQGDDPRTARRLSGSLQGHGTGWCTAGESTAATQLAKGDFYVFYTRDEDGKDTVPRIAIRMENGEVAEARGVNASQELEPIMVGTVSEKLAELPGGEAYTRRVADMKRLTTIEQRVLADPNVELTNDELRFLYELDHEIEGFGYDKDPRIAEIKAMRGNQDKPELNRILSEAIREQVKPAYLAYKMVADKILGDGGSLNEFGAAASAYEVEQLFAAKDREWRTNGVYDYLVEKLIAEGAQFRLVATPNIEANESQIVALAEAFGKGQPYKTVVDDDLYRRAHYTGRELSGNKGTAPIRFGLMPNCYDSEMSKHRAEALEQLHNRRTERPELDVRVPSLLEAITYWHVLRVQGDKLDDRKTYARTHICHFDLPSKMKEGKRVIPSSAVGLFVGEPILGYVTDGINVRLAVG